MISAKNIFMSMISFSALAATYTAPVHAITRLESTSKWIVTMQAETELGKFEYADSSLRNLIKVKIGYFATTAGDGSKTSKYEIFWMKEGKPLALERYCKLAIPANDDVAIRIDEHKAMDYSEQSSVADAILRVLLDLYANGNIVTRIIVPSGSIAGISAALQGHNFTTTRPTQATKLAVFLQTEDGTSTTLYYTR